MPIRTKLATAIFKSGLSKVEIAKHLGISRPTLDRDIKEGIHPNPKLAKYADLLNATPESLTED